MSWLEDVLTAEGDEELLDLAVAMAERRLLVAYLPGQGRALTIESIARLVLEGRLRGSAGSGGEPIPSYNVRMGKRAILQTYLRGGQGKYCIVRSRGVGALTPRRTYMVSRASLPRVRVWTPAGGGLLALVAPNSTLRGALRRIQRRGSINAFVVRGGRLHGLIDLWTILRVIAEGGEKMMEAPCSAYVSSSQVARSHRELDSILAEYGFGALARPGAQPLLIDDVALLEALRSAGL